MSKELVNIAAGLRLDLKDVRDLAINSTLKGLAQIGDQLIAGPTTETIPRTKSIVLSDFAASVATTAVTVRGGSAVVGTHYDGETVEGLVLSGGSAEKTIEIGGYADGTYGLFVRLELAPTTYENRTYWDPSASPSPTEVTKNSATRLVEDWSPSVALVSPGSEWVRLGEITKTGASLVYADQRPFAFDVDGGGNPRWGSATERQYPRVAAARITGVAQFAQFALTQIRDLIGASGADTPHPFRDLGVSGGGDVDAGTGYVGVGQLNAGKLSRHGGQLVSGYLPFDTAGVVPGTLVSNTILGHANVLKAYGIIEMHSGTPTLRSGSFGIDTVVDDAGNVRVTLDRAMANTNYVVQVGVVWAPASASSPAGAAPAPPYWQADTASQFLLYPNGHSASDGFVVQVYGVSS